MDPTQQFGSCIYKDRSITVMVITYDVKHYIGTYAYHPSCFLTKDSLEQLGIKTQQDLTKFYEDSILDGLTKDDRKLTNVRLLAPARAAGKLSVELYPLSPFVDLQDKELVFPDVRVALLVPPEYEKAYLQACSGIQLI